MLVQLDPGKVLARFGPDGIKAGGVGNSRRKAGAPAGRLSYDDLSGHSFLELHSRIRSSWLM